MRNPWETIALSDYENHMSLENVYQLQVLNQMMAQQLAADADTVMILGIAGGNGLEHINREKARKVYGVDVNPDYLAQCRKRYPELGDTLETICVDLLDAQLHLPAARLLIADLLVEYIGYERFRTVVEMVGPEFISCIIQINTGDAFVADSPDLHAFDCLEALHHQMAEDALTACMAQIGYGLRHTAEHGLPNGKKLVRLDFALAEEDS